MTSAGLAIGIPLVFGGSHYLKSLLHGVEPNDPIAITMAVALLFASGLFAGFIPARRASLIDPLRAMRCE